MDWPSNWRELRDKLPECDRCRSIEKLYLLSEDYPNIQICRNCAMAYHLHIKNFVNDIYSKKLEEEPTREE